MQDHGDVYLRDAQQAGDLLIAALFKETERENFSLSGRERGEGPT